ncbi:hypothetical protein BGC07_06070 [Piscirickettsia litoralis]|uniref:Uncharacterized protein n=2 Tax=Piscirickettsia litoralis TaxID=1891921 RepID=A0ABX3A2W5_9GAMM|nr:hypothetical protein BGC07_06070 [Piscirickettsia litoralis]
MITAHGANSVDFSGEYVCVGYVAGHFTDDRYCDSIKITSSNPSNHGNSKRYDIQWQYNENKAGKNTSNQKGHGVGIAQGNTISITYKEKDGKYIDTGTLVFNAEKNK